MLRQFTLFTYSMEISDFILNTDFLPKTERYLPHIFEDRELIDMFEYAIRLKDDDLESLKHRSYP